MQRSTLLIALFAPAILISCTSRHHFPVVVEPDAMPKIGSVSERFLAYNVEMVQLTGGHFGRPMRKACRAPGTTATNNALRLT